MCRGKYDEGTYENAYNLETWGDYKEELQYKYPYFYKWLENLEIQYDSEELLTYDFFARRPYYQLRGKRVTPEQAFEIIRRCDDSFYVDDYLYDMDGLVGYRYAEDEIEVLHYHLSSWLFEPNHFPMGYGWCYPDGSIGVNNMCGRFPNMLELVTEFTTLLYTFPYLDIMVGYTECNEVLVDDEVFEDEIRLGICLHDNVIELLDRENALKRYNEYVEKYEEKDVMYDPCDRYRFVEKQRLSGDNSLYEYARRCSMENKKTWNDKEKER